MSCPQLSIGLVAYGLTPGRVLVRVPNERGRWVLTDRSVAEVPCPLCQAVTGEPCHNGKAGRLLRYSQGTHVKRRDLAQRQLGRGYPARLGAHKLRATPEELAAPAREPDDDANRRRIIGEYLEARRERDQAAGLHHLENSGASQDAYLAANRRCEQALRRLEACQ